MSGKMYKCRPKFVSFFPLTTCTGVKTPSFFCSQIEILSLPPVLATSVLKLTPIAPGLPARVTHRLVDLLAGADPAAEKCGRLAT